MWIYLPTSYLCVPASEASTLPRDSHFQRLARSAWSREKRLRAASWRRAWSKASFMKLLSGVTLRPSTAARGVASWIRSLQASPANRTPLPANVRAQQTSATSGPTPCESSETCSPASSSSKTSLASSATCPRGLSLICSGTAGECLDRFCLKPQALELRTDASECSSWPTANATAHKGGTLATDERTTTQSRIATVAETWRGSSGYSEKQLNRPGGCPRILNYDAAQWATPQCPTGGPEQREDKRKRESGGEDLQTQAMTTPQVSEPDSAPRPSRAATGRTTEYLGRQIQTWTTPMVPNGGRNGPRTEEGREGETSGIEFQAATFSPPAPPTPDGPASSETPPGSPPPSAKRRLNAYFVEVLQGLPLNWTSPTASIGCAAWETWLSLCRERLRSVFSGGD